MKAFKCDCCGIYCDDAPSKVVRVIFGSDQTSTMYAQKFVEPDICEDCQVKIAKMFPLIKVRDKITKEEL